LSSLECSPKRCIPPELKIVRYLKCIIRGYILPWSGCLFPGFKAHSSRTGEAVQSGPRLKPCKRQTAPATGRGRQPFTGRGYFFSLNTSAPCFLRLLTWGSLAPSAFALRCACGDAVSPPLSKSQENYGSFPLNCSKKYPLPVNALHNGLKLITGCFFWKRFASAL